MRTLFLSSPLPPSPPPLSRCRLTLADFTNLNGEAPSGGWSHGR